MSDMFISPLSTLVSPNQVPEELNFISSGISGLLNNVYYKNLIIKRYSSTSSVSPSLAQVCSWAIREAYLCL